ncbi:MAG: oligosaccharide flippase family protein [Steroidobacteraceae bacterium]|nr:oligosaccharide flippase family protein [Steroidobacteraceae bacterium]
MNALIASVRTRVRSSPTAQRIAVGAAWSMGGAIAERALALGGSIAIVRLLGKESFGEFAILQSTLAMIGVFAGLGLGVTATKYVAELKARDPERLGRILAFASRAALASSILIAAALVAGSGFISRRILDMPQNAGLLAVSALALLFTTLQNYQSGVLIGFEALRKSTTAGICTALISIPVSVTLTFFYGLAGAVWGLVLSAALRWLLNRWMLLPCLRSWRIPRAPRDWASEWRAMRDFGLPALLANIMVTPAHWICHAMLVNTPGGKEQMAVLGVANQWYYAMLLLPMAAGRIVLPVLTDTVTAKQSARGAKVLLLGMLANGAIVLPFVLVLGFGAPFVMSLYGESYAAHWQVLAIAVGTAGLVAIQTPVGAMLAASDRMWLGALMNLGWATAYVTIAWLLLNKGATGIAVALLCAYVLHALWTFAFAAHKLKPGANN